MEESIRAFIAIELSAELKALLGQVAQELQKRIPEKAVRWVKPEAMHLTLVFLGNTPLSKIEPVKVAMTTAARQTLPMEMAAVGLGCFPSTRRPQNIWVGIREQTGQMEKLKHLLDAGLEPLGFKPEDRKFSPHLTLGRVNKRTGRSDEQQVGQVIESATLGELGAMPVDRILLIKSNLQPTGPIYSPLAGIMLGPDSEMERTG